MGYNPDLKSSTLLNAIKASASDTYKARIPDATKDNLAEVGSAILNFTVTRNEFVAAMLNRSNYAFGYFSARIRMIPSSILDVYSLDSAHHSISTRPPMHTPAMRPTSRDNTILTISGTILLC